MKFKEILKNTPENGEVETRSENDMLLEVLSSIRSMDRRMRRIEDIDNYKSFDDKRRAYLTRDGVILDDDLETEIMKMINNRMPKELIMEILEDKYKLSRNLSISKLNKCMTNLNKELSAYT